MISRLLHTNIHTRRLAIARLLLALGMLLTMLFNDAGTITNHHYSNTTHYRVKHSSSVYQPFKTLDVFTHASPQAGKAIIIIVLLLVMSGWLPQITCLLHVMACFSISNYIICADGGDQLALTLSVLLVPVCLTDPRLNQWRTGTFKSRLINICSNVAYMAICVQAAIVYLYSGVSKMYGAEWQEGTAMYYFSSHYQLGAPGWLRTITELITTTPLVALISWAVIAIELLLFACLLAPPRVKKIMLVVALIMHGLIILVHGLVSFFFTMAGMLVLYLLPPSKD